MILYYVRHGDPIYHPDSLTQLGQLQAAAAAKRLARYGMDRIYSSTSNRAIQTAQPLCDLLKQEPILLDWANEEGIVQDTIIHYADGSRKWCWMDPEIRSIFRSKQVYDLGRSWYDHPAFRNRNFARGMEQIQQEADAFMLSLGYRHDLQNNCYHALQPQCERIALFAHEGFGAVFLSCVLDIPYPIFSTHFRMTHSGITAIAFEEQDGVVVPQVLCYSNDSHIYADGLPTKHRNHTYI